MSWASAHGERPARACRVCWRLLEQNLKEEKAADGKLTTIAEGSVNEDAAEEWQSHDSEQAGILERSAAWVGGAVGLA